MKKYDVEKLKQKIKCCQNVSMDNIDINSIDDLSKVKIDRKKKGNDRILDFINKVSNPYIFKIDNQIVKIEFTNNGKSAEESITNVISKIYK